MDNKGYQGSNGALDDSAKTVSPLSPKKLPPITNENGGAVNGATNGKVAHRDAENGAVGGGEEEEQQEFHEPFFYARWIVKYPKLCFFTTLGMHLFFLFLVIVLTAAGVNIVPLVFERLPLDITDNVEYLRGLAWQERDESNLIYDRSSTGDDVLERTEQMESIEWYFEIPGGNVLRQKHLKDMQKTEDKLWGDNKFQSSFCMTQDGSTCFPPRSILRLFDGTFDDLDSNFTDPDYDNIETVLTTALQYEDTNALLDYALGKGATVRANKVKVSIVRGQMSVGTPLDGYDDAEHKLEKQEKEFEDYCTKTFIPKAQKIYEKGVGKMDFYYASPSIIGLYITDTVFTDIALAIGSLIFIYLFMWFQTRSLFITTFAIYSIVNGFLITDVIYIGILQIKYLGIFHVLSLFIVLGIGADDVFVFMDTWTEASHKKWPSVEHRLDHTFRHAGMAMLYTSLTTSVAFFVSAGSPFLGVNSFGIFSGLLVIFNYFSVVIFFPTVVIMYHTYFEKFKCCCCCPVTKSADDVPPKKNIIVRFFAGPYFRFITHKVFRWVILGFFAVLIAITAYFASTIEIQEEQLKFLPDNTNIGAYIEKDAEEFGTGEFPQRLFIIWGLKEQDISSCDPSDAECYGKTRFQNKLNMRDADTQQALWNFCEDLRTLSSSKIKDLKIKVNSITNEPEVNCFVDEMKDFLEEDETRVVYNPTTSTFGDRYTGGENLGFPVNQSVVTDIMDAVDYIYDSSALDGDFNRWFEIAMSYWLYDGFQIDNATDKAVLGQQFDYYSELLGTSDESYTIDFDDTNDLLDFSYKYGTRLRYAAITVNLTVNPLTLGFPTGLPIRDKWEKWVSDKMKDMPSELKHGFQTTPIDYYGFNLWHWLYVQENLALSAAQGIIIGLAIAFPILVIATMNIVVGFFATMTIGLITLAVLGFIPMAGWKLGVLESLNLVLVVGLSVDYCVHLAEGYARCKKPDRASRLQSALEEVGISVVSGALTTLGASFFLMLAVIIFFLRFGIFMFVTIGFSCIYALGLFMTILGLIGPQNEFGSLRPLLRKMKKMCCKKKEGES